MKRKRTSELANPKASSQKASSQKASSQKAPRAQGPRSQAADSFRETIGPGRRYALSGWNTRLAV
ncbi:hypothetical protein LLE49_15785 [Alicyclobacillus tolerans]|uniref:hypothetical protein n=1 Tax=Alicyclobacillus tolerans TaxID=90970 RepID=UPI001F1DFFFF|nr:hypothetical protein [Alicyclobacillus tolerans]MCF8566187.1 hypothetical protein [Alicyclobacillus tolerans]